MTATCKSKIVAAGEQISLQVVIDGAGNLTVINPPLISLPDGLEGFDPVTKEKVDKTIYPLSGSKTFEYTFIAKDTGDYKIPSVVFAYFNPAETAYKTLRSDSFTIHVTPALKKKSSRLFNNPNGNTITPDSWIDISPVTGILCILAVVFVATFGIYQWKKSGKTQRKRAPTVEQSTAAVLKRTG